MLTGFIIVEALVVTDEIDKLLEKEEQWVDVLINTHDISTVVEDEDNDRCYIALMSSDKEVETKNTLDEIIQKIRRATALNFYTQ
jgi:hypothetical protein